MMHHPVNKRFRKNDPNLSSDKNIKTYFCFIMAKSLL